MTPRPKTPPIIVRPDDLFGRKGPHHPEVEGSVLSDILTDRGAIDLVRDILRAEHFDASSNATIYGAMCDLHDRKIPVDFESLAAELRRSQRLDTIGDDLRSGVSYLVHLINGLPSLGNLEHHARLLVDAWRVRTLQATCLQIAAEATNDFGDAVSFIDHAERRVFEIAAGNRREKGAVFLDALIDRELERQRRIQRGELAAPGISTGIAILDAKTGGFRRGETWVVAGRPGMGKTALLLAMARAVGSAEEVQIADDGTKRTAKLAALVQSIEMTDEQLPRRYIAAEARVSVLRATTGKLSDAELDAYISAGIRLKETVRVAIDDASYVTPSSLRARVRRAVSAARAKSFDLFAVFVDYVQRMHGDPSGDRSRSREREVAECATACAEIAKEFGVCMILGAQLNRDVEGRSGKDMRPKLKDLRESGQIEQDAQQILFLHRPEYYIADKDKIPEELKGFTEGILAKVRDGEPGIIPIGFEAYCTRFHEWTGASATKKKKTDDPEKEKEKTPPKTKGPKKIEASELPMFPEDETYDT